MQIIRKRGGKPRWTSETTETMLRLHKARLTPTQMTKHIPFSEATIRLKHDEFWLKPNAIAAWKSGVHEHERPAPKTKPNPLNLAKRVFGEDFDHDDECMRLNGTPIRFLDLMRETNKRLHARGEEQWTGDESCVIR